MRHVLEAVRARIEEFSLIWPSGARMSTEESLAGDAIAKAMPEWSLWRNHQGTEAILNSPLDKRLSELRDPAEVIPVGAVVTAIRRCRDEAVSISLIG